MKFEKILKIGRNSHNKFLQKIINKYIRKKYFCDILCETKIADNVVFAHQALGCVVSKEAIIKEDCFIQHRVTIGVKRSGEGAPVLESGVAVGPGAIIVGNIVLGNHCVVGAGAVVVNDVPPYAVVGGVPAKILYFLEREI